MVLACAPENRLACAPENPLACAPENLPLLPLLAPLILLPLLLSALFLLVLLLISWLFLHQVQEDINPKGVVALLTSSATRSKP